MNTRRTKALACLAVVIAASAAFIAFNLTKSSPFVVGEQINVVYAKDAWVKCLSHPESEGVLLSFSGKGLVIQETTTQNIDAVTQGKPGRAQCQSEGIREVDKATRQFFVPFSALHEVRSGPKVVWRSKNAT